MKLLIAKTDGSVEIKTFCPENAFLKLPADLEKWKGANPGLYLSHRPIEDHEIPTDRSFRNAWRFDGDGIVVDMEHAAQIHAERLTVSAQQDAKREALMSVARSSLFAAAKTPEDLKAIPAVPLD